MNLFWRGELQSAVWPPRIIHADPVRRGLPGLRSVFKIRIQPIFLFQNPVDALRYSILRTMVLFGHAHSQARLLHRLHVGVGRILASPIRVVDGPGRSWEPLQRHRQSFEHLLGLQRFTQMIPHDFARPPVCNQG